MDGRVRDTIGTFPVTSLPQARLQAFRLHPPARAPLEALVAMPAQPSGLMFHFPGFNVALGSWEALRCARLAEVTGLAVVAIELPGLSRLGHRLPDAVRRDLNEGRCEEWAELSLGYLRLAVAEAGVAGLPVRLLSGFSTGCSLAVAVQRRLGDQVALSLVEPVSLTTRSVAALEAANVADLSRLPRALAGNRGWGRAGLANPGGRAGRPLLAARPAGHRRPAGRTQHPGRARPAHVVPDRPR